MIFMRLQSLMKKLLLGFAVIFLFACGSGDNSSSVDEVLPLPSAKHFVKGTGVGVVPKVFLTSGAQSAGYGQIAPYMKYSIKLYKIIYRTTYKGEPILASGLIAYPTGFSDPMPTLIVGNIMTYADKDAPSEAVVNKFTPLAAIASTGYLTLIPDMIGYGVSKDIIYPMQNYEYSANAMIDFIHAGEEFIESAKLQVNGKKFLAGYSEGGYIAMATLKMIETGPASGINITATAVGAGGYNLLNIFNEVIINGTGTYDAPSHLAMFLYSYNSMYDDWDRPLSYFFQESYAGKIPDLLNGTYNREQIDQQLTTSLNSLLSPVFLDDLKNNEPFLINALNENSVDDWAPNSLLMIFHNTHDEKVPFSDSEETFNKMLFNGSGSVIFEKSIKPGTHVDSGIEFMEIVYQWFETMK